MNIDDNKPRIDTLKRMLAVGKSLAKNEMSEVYELGHYIADNVLIKLCMLIGIEENRDDLVFRNKNKTWTKDFKELYNGILLNFYPTVPKYNDFAQKYHRNRNIYQHGIEHLDLKTIKKPVVIEYIKFVEKIMKIVGYLGKDVEIKPISILLTAYLPDLIPNSYFVCSLHLSQATFAIFLILFLTNTCDLESE